MIEREHHLRTVLLHGCVERAPAGDAGQLVGLGKCPAGQSLGDVLLVHGVDVLAFAKIDDHRLAGGGEGLHGHRLGLAEFRPVALGRLCLLLLEVGELHPVEGEIAEAPLLPPRRDHERKEFAVLIGPAGVRFALIPDRPLDAVADRGREHAGVDVAGAGVALHPPGGILFGVGLAGRLGPARGLRLFGSLLPLGHLLLELLLRRFVLGLLLLPLLMNRLEEGVGRELVSLHPGLGGAAAPGVVDQAHRHAERLVKLPAKEVADRGEVADRFGRAHLPLSVEVPLWVLRAHLRHRHEADVRKLRSGLLQIGIIGLVHAPLHV